MTNIALSTTGASSGRADRAIGAWLLLLCAMVFSMVVLGGITRLTHSGLSMVEWKPLTGFLPPMSEAAWQDIFEKYKQFPEYLEINRGMDLQEFESIFWLEFLHRVLGRLIGVVFLVPFLWFLLRGHVARSGMPGLGWKLALAFVLGGLQGLLGWYMVKSGLVDRPDVSQYRLTAHLAAAFIIYGYMLWLGFGLIWPRRSGARLRHGNLWRNTILVTALAAVTILSGGLVAGLDAGFIYNTFPLMGDGLVPEEFMTLSPWWANFLENIPQVQFDHRVLAITTMLAVVLLWTSALRAALPGPVRGAYHALLAVAAAQVALGISTLLLVVPVDVAVTHQAGALILFTALLWSLHQLRRHAA